MTPTPTRTPTRTAAPCPGDCDASGIVRVNELVLAVNIALDVSTVSECTSVDRDANLRVTA